MNYEQTYYTLMLRGKQREVSNPLVGYTERHHIDPRCMGGTDDEFNLVSLTPEEHWIAHKLLVKMYPGNPSLIYALVMMSKPGRHTSGRPTRRLYGAFKRKLSVTTSEQMKGNQHAFGLIHTTESRTRMSKNQKGKNKGKVRTAEHRESVGRANKKRVWTDEMRAQHSVSMKGKNTGKGTRKPKKAYVASLIAQLLELTAAK